MLQASVYPAGGVGQPSLPPFLVTQKKFVSFSAASIGIQIERKGSIRHKGNHKYEKYRLEEKAFFPLTINKSLHITIYVNKQSIGKAFHLKVPQKSRQLKLCAAALLYLLHMHHQKSDLPTEICSFYCFAFLGPSNSTIKIYFMISPTHKMLKSTLTFTKCYNQWCNLCK